MSTLAFRSALGAGVLLAAAAGIFFAVYGNVNQDEGWYLNAAHRLYAGALPYRDFAFFQMPFLPFVYGAPQVLLGPELLVGRLTSLALLWGTIALAARLAFERGGRVAALAVLALLSLTPLALWTLSTTRTEPLSAFLWTACAFLLLRGAVSPRVSGGALLAAVLAAATRITSLPAAGFVLLWVVMRHRSSSRDLAVALLPAGVAAGLVCAVLLLAGAEAAWFNLVASQTTRHAQLGPAEAWGPMELVTTRLIALARVAAAYGPGPVIALAAGLAAAVRWPKIGGDSTTRVGLCAGLVALGLAVYLPNLAPRFVYPHYFASAFPLFAVLLGCALGWSLERATGGTRTALVALALGLLALQGVTFARRLDVYASVEQPQLLELREAGAQIARAVPEDAKLLTLDTYLAVASRRAVVPGFEMGMFSWSPGWPEETARRFGVATPALLEEALRDPSVGGVALSDQALGLIVRERFGGYAPGKRIPEAALHEALPGLIRWRLVKVVPRFGQFDDALYLLTPAP